MRKAQREYDPREAGQLIARLSATARRVTRDDLSALAQMHGWCDRLAEQFGADGPRPLPPADELLSSLGQALEALILGEARDPDSTLKSVTDQITQLEAIAPAETGSDVSSSTPTEDRLAAVDAPAPERMETPARPRPSPPTPPAALPQAQSATYASEPLRLNPNEIDFVKGFAEEAAEHIEAIEAALLEVERTPTDTDKINDLFRPFHTIKGMAGFLNLRDINSLTHEAETLLDEGRKGKRRVTTGLIDLIFDVVDILKAQVAAIGAYLADPQGDIVPQPPVAEMIDKLRDVVAGRITLDSTDRDPPRAGGRVGENLVAAGAITTEQIEQALDVQETAPDKKVGEILMDMGAATAKQVGQALRAQAPPTGTGNAGTVDASVRIDTAKLDALVDMVGELVIAQTLVNANRIILEDGRLSKDVSQVTKIVRNVQEMAMAMRMVPIASTFQKMARLVRDVSRKAGKEVELTISGEDTELDKNVIQQISDPLVHMVRNAVDHGIEPPDVRRAAGKPAVGKVHLAAYHQGGNIVIEIRDDGKGLDAQALIAKGIEKGLVQPGEELTEQQAFALIFAPGFSMAARITDISGRGVGMDVVRRNIEALRGKVEISSEKGKGSTFHIRLPLTLAIIDGMVVGLKQERFIIPTITIEQALRPVPGQIHTVQHRGEMIQVRGQLIPLIQLGQLFGFAGRIDPCEHMVVICNCDGKPAGIVVDDLIGQQQVVIKTLGERFQGLKGVAGAAILGDGRVGLILEPSGLAALNNTQRATGATTGESEPIVGTETAKQELVEACAS